MSRPNYYILLELPETEKDSSTIEAAIKKKQAIWCRGRTHPTKNREAQRNLDALKDIRKVMADPALRAEEARDAGRLRAELKKEAELDLLDAINVAAAEGYMLEGQVADLAKWFAGRLSEAEIRSKVRVPIRKSPRPPDSAPKATLHPSVARHIRRLLKVLDKRDLYEFLSLPWTSSPPALHSRATDLYNMARRNNNKTAEVVATQELAGHCHDLFKSEEAREKYDNTLSLERLTSLGSLIEFAGSARREIGAMAMEQLLRKARERGVDQKEAQAYILAFAPKRKYIVTVPAETWTEHGPTESAPSGAGARGLRLS